jgi:hypothetical protein
MVSSRSGEGAHVWFFFSDPVRAALARRFGLMLLTDAMARSPTLGMASYDRLFPSQDPLPKGGFGNLIALPLQLQARQRGNTLFVDERLEPFEDQWSYLESLPRIAPARLQELVARGLGDGRVLGVPEETEDSDAPWRPVRPLTERLAAGKLPGTVSATLAQRLYVRSEGLPPVLLDALRRLAAFSNPKFLELQAMRKSTARTPRVIACFEQTGRFLALPRGCCVPLEELLAGLNIALEPADKSGAVDRSRGPFSVPVGACWPIFDRSGGAAHVRPRSGPCMHGPADRYMYRSGPRRMRRGHPQTPKRRDGHHPIITMQCGPVRHTIAPDATRSSQPLALRVVRRDTPFDPKVLPTDAGIQEIYAALVADKQRTELIAKDTLELTAQGHCPIVLTERRERLAVLRRMFAKRLRAYRSLGYELAEIA